MSEINKSKTGMHIASFILGIISVVSVLFWYITIPTGILAIVFGVKSIKKIGSKLGKTGMILGIIGLSLFVFIYISLVLIIILSGL